MKSLMEDVPHCKLLRFKRGRKPGNAKEVKRPHKCQRLMTVRHWWGKMYKPMNTGPFQGVQADVPGDFRTFRLGACGCAWCVLLLISFAKSQIKTAFLVILLGPYTKINHCFSCVILKVFHFAKRTPLPGVNQSKLNVFCRPDMYRFQV